MSSYLSKTNTSKKDLNRVLRFEAGRSSAGENASWGARATEQLPQVSPTSAETGRDGEDLGTEGAGQSRVLVTPPM